MRRNLHILVIEEEGVAVCRKAFHSHDDALATMRAEFVEMAGRDDQMDTELFDLYGPDEDHPEDPPLVKVVAGLSDIDLIDWWQSRRTGNAVRLFEVGAPATD